jgi:hypothetical protein
MFGKIAADALGLSDIGVVVKAPDYDKTDADDYVINEEGEQIFFLIKSKTDEYCFTNRALIHVDGTSAISKKRTLRRLDYTYYNISNVLLETAGTVDLDVEIKFDMGGIHYSIDIHKKHIEEIKDLYKALLKIASIQRENERLEGYVHNSLDTAAKAVGRSSSGATTEADFKGINQYTFDILKAAYETYNPRDFGHVFDLYIKN